MKPRSSLVILVVVVAAVAAIAVYELVVVPGKERKEKQESLFFPELDKQAVTRLEITKGDTATVLVRQGDTAWKLGDSGYKADQEAVSGALEKLAKLERGIIASRNKESHRDLEVDEQGLEVKAAAKDELLARLVIGKQGKSYGTSFVRKGESEEVYMASENLKSSFDKTESEWRDKNIFSEKLDRVTRILIEQGLSGGTQESMLISRDNEQGWELVLEGDTAKKLAKSKVDSLARTLTSLRAAEFADQVSLEEAGLDEPDKKATFALEDGSSLTLMVGDKDDSKFFVKRGDQDTVFKVYQYNVKNIFKTKEDLFPKEQKMPDVSPELPAPKLQKQE